MTVDRVTVKVADRTPVDRTGFNSEIERRQRSGTADFDKPAATAKAAWRHQNPEEMISQEIERVLRVPGDSRELVYNSFRSAFLAEAASAAAVATTYVSQSTKYSEGGACTMFDL